MNGISSQIWIVFGAISGFLGVALGAFGAHALKDTLSPGALAVYQTAHQYQMFHSLALLAYGIWKSSLAPFQAEALGAAPGLAPVFLAVGILVFSGSLYALAITDIRWLGAITPIGGVAFLVGWLLWAWAAYQIIQNHSGN